jgi:hypothetical protein
LQVPKAREKTVNAARAAANPAVRRPNPSIPMGGGGGILTIFDGRSFFTNQLHTSKDTQKGLSRIDYRHILLKYTVKGKQKVSFFIFRACFF